jgi:hypothetical protein
MTMMMTMVTTTRTTTMIDPTPEKQESLARKRLRIRQMTDPLGVMGFRHPRARREREGRARRFTFVAAIAAFFGTFGAIAFGTARPPAAADPQASVTADRIIRQYVVKDINGDTTLIRVLAPPTSQESPRAHVRTRSS